MKKIYLLCFICLSISKIFSQTFTISGYIQDLSSGEKLIGANVYNEATGEGTITNNYGFYSLSLPGNQSVEITFSYIGYQNEVRKINLSANQSINVDLTASITLDAVEVVAEKNKRIERETQMSVAEVPMAQLKKVPALLGEVDVLKALQLLPGVKSGGEGQSGLYVRGGGPDQNLILLDGVPVYNASHLFGFFSVFNADAIKDVKLIKGGYPARYGGRLSSVLEINMKDGNINEFKGTASIGLISSKLTLEGPINKGKTSFIVSGRRTYLDVLARPFIKKGFKNEGQDGSVGYYFYDLNAKINHKFSDKDRLYLSSYGGRDRFFFKTKDLEGDTRDFADNSLAWGNFTTALRWNHVISPKMFVNTTATYSDYRLKTDFEFGSNRSSDPDYVDAFGLNYISGIEDLGLKVDVDYVPNPNHFIRFGANVIKHTFKPGEFSLYNESSNENFSFKDTIGQANIGAVETGLYVEDDWNISKNMKVNAGLHFSSFLLNEESYFSLQPRVSSRFLLPKDWSMKASFATMRQYINLLSFEGIGLPTDLWVPSTDKIKPQDSWQAAFGTAKTINDSYELSVEVYYKKMNNLVAYKDGAGVFQTDDWQNRVVQGKGDAYGTELFLQKKEGRLSGWVGYTLSWTYRNFPDIDNGARFPYRFDRRHDFSIVGNYNITPKINLAATWVFSTGNAVTLAGTRYDGTLPQTDNEFFGYSGNDIEVFGNRNNFRMRSYHRLDIGVNFTKKKKSYERVWSFGAYNAYANNNPFFLYYGNTYDEITGNTKRVLKQTALFPLVPYITWTANF